MLSGALNRQRHLKQLLKASQASTPLMQRQLRSATAPTTPTAFKNADNIIMNGDQVYAVIPTYQEGYLWDSWVMKIYSYDNTATGVEAFIKLLSQQGVIIDNHIDSYDNATSTTQTINTAVTSLTQTTQAALAIAQTLENNNYTIFQVTLSTFLSAFSYLANKISTDFTECKNDLLALKKLVNDLEDSQIALTPAVNKAALFPKPLTEMKPLMTNAKPLDSTAESKPEVEVKTDSTPALPGPFVGVTDMLIINNTHIELSMPAKGKGCLKLWQKESVELDNTEAEYEKLIYTLLNTKTDLDNSSQKYENITNLIQSWSAMCTSFIGMIQTAVAGASSLNATSLQIFQITISALNALLSVATKVATATVTTYRNNTLTFSGDTAEMLTAQLKP
jgi:hypothetical protein